MTIHIPIWVLWTVGGFIVIPIVVMIGAFAYMGWQIMKSFTGWKGW